MSADVAPPPQARQTSAGAEWAASGDARVCQTEPKPVGPEGHFKVEARTTNIQQDGLEDRLERVGRTSRYIGPAALAYTRGDVDSRFGALHLNVNAEEWHLFVKDVQRFIVDRGHQAVVNSVEKDPSEITNEPHIVIFAAALLESEDE